MYLKNKLLKDTSGIPTYISFFLIAIEFFPNSWVSYLVIVFIGFMLFNVFYEFALSFVKKNEYKIGFGLFNFSIFIIQIAFFWGGFFIYSTF